MGKHRLSRPGLPRDRVQARAEPQFGPLDQQQVLDPQLAQHENRFSSASGGSCAHTFAICGVRARRRGSAAQRS